MQIWENLFEKYNISHISPLKTIYQFFKKQNKKKNYLPIKHTQTCIFFFFFWTKEHVLLPLLKQSSLGITEIDKGYKTPLHP